MLNTYISNEKRGINKLYAPCNHDQTMKGFFYEERNILYGRPFIFYYINTENKDIDEAMNLMLV